MIYIDPPYNTGNDFVYADDFTDPMARYKEVTEQTTKSNPETMGRFHTNWLNMMYPRLRLAANLLRDDGVIFISIDEIEMPNLRKLCDEVFGEENHVADFVWHNKRGGGNDSKYVAVEHEYVLMYSKNLVNLDELFVPYSPSYLTRYKEQDETGKYFWDTFKRKSGKQYYPIVCPDGTVLEKDDLGNPISWLRSEPRFHDDISMGEIRIVKINDKWSVQFKQRIPEGKKPRTIFLEESIFEQQGTTGDGSNEVLQLFEKNIFDNPKPINLIKHLLNFDTSNDDIILDFFSGSATTAHAVMQLNAEDGGNRKFICVQLPEICDEKSEAYKAGYKNICEIGKERIRRAGKKIVGDVLCPSRDLLFASRNPISNDTDQMSLDMQDENAAIARAEQSTAITRAEQSTAITRAEQSTAITRAEQSAAIARAEQSAAITRAEQSAAITRAEQSAAITRAEQSAAPTGVDIGFKVFKLDTSNIKTWDGTPIESEQLRALEDRMNEMIHRVKPDRTDMDMVTEIMLKLGVPLTYPVTKIALNGKTAYTIGDDCLLLICLADDLKPDDVEKMAEYAPAKLIISRDSFKDDTAMANAYYILRDKGIELKLV